MCTEAKTKQGQAFIAGAKGARDVLLDPCKPQPITLIAETKIQLGTGARFSVFPPENATGNFVKIVQRVPVKLVFDDKPDVTLPIGPGMSVSPIVYTK